jgi:tetratricopeptide (TPR) repeat protein
MHNGDRRRRRRGWRSFAPEPLLLCVVLACSSQEDQAREHLERARHARDRGDLTAAEIEYKTSLQSAPNLAEAHYELAVALLELGRGDEAVWELRESFRLQPENLDARLRFAWLMLAAQQPAEALEQAEAILERDPDHLEGRLVQAAALLAAGDLERAGSESQAILERWPSEKRAHYNLARVRAGQQRLDDAERHLLRYHELDGASLEATQEVVRFYAVTGRRADAEAFLTQAIPSAAPADRAELALALAELLESGGRLREAEGPLRQALSGAPTRLDVRERLVDLLVRERRFPEAASVVEAGRSLGLDAAPLHRVLGDVWMAAGRYQDALAEFRAGLSLVPDSTALRLREAEALLQIGDVAGSTELIHGLLAENPEQPLLVLRQHRTMALASRGDEAIRGLRDLIAREPQLAPAHFLLGVLELARQRPADATRSLEIARDRLTGRSQLEARRLLAEARLLLGEFDAAVAEAEVSLVQDPQHVRTRIVLAQALLGAGSAQRAETVLLEAEVKTAELEAALARVYVETQRLERAQAAAERALALEPDAIQRVVDVVWVLLEQGKTSEALEAARSRMQEQPGVPDYPNLVGQVLLEQNDVAGAQRAFQRAIDVDPDFVPGYINLARFAARAGRYAAARELLQRALRLQPDDVEALRELGIVEYGSGNAGAAVEAFRAALRADPTSAVTRSNLAQAQASAGEDLASVLEISRAIRQENPEDPIAAETLGIALEHAGLHQAAADQFRAAIDLAPHPVAAYHFRLGLALLGSGDRSQASREIERALAIDPDFPDADEARRRLGELAAERAG